VRWGGLNQDILELRSFDPPIFILQHQSASHIKGVMFSFHLNPGEVAEAISLASATSQSDRWQREKNRRKL